jgi:RNA polymerase sigma-70 factor, ECF subfamily
LDSQADSSLRVALVAQPAEGVSESSRVEDEVTEFYDRFRNPLLRYILAIGLTIHDGEEVIQEVFLSLFEHLRSGKSRHNIRGWLFRVAHNLALRQRNANRSQMFAQSEENWFSRFVDRTPNPEEALAHRQRQERLLAVVRALPEQDRCCLHLRGEGLRYREIAEVIGISLGAVSISLVRSLARLGRADSG